MQVQMHVHTKYKLGKYLLILNKPVKFDKYSFNQFEANCIQNIR